MLATDSLSSLLMYGDKDMIFIFEWIIPFSHRTILK